MNEQIIFAKRPAGMPEADTFQFEEIPMPEAKEGEVVVQTLYLSVDPYMRGRMNDQKSYVPPFQVGEPFVGGIVGRVIQTKSSSYKQGDIVTGLLPWQRYTVVLDDHIQKIDPELAPVSTALGVLGMPGLTAYFGLLDIGQPKAGETVVVSGAAGAVGMIVGQIAKIKGARVVGIAGAEEKIAYLKGELGFDAVINYKTDNVKEALKEACPNGVDVYFENVGGEISDVVAGLLNKHARIPLCGQISLYNLEKPDVGPRIQTQLLINSALMKGFIVADYADRFQEGIQQLGEWVQQGKLKYRENIVEGFENVPEAFLGLFSGANLGKQLVKVAE
ncbi:NADP-dependent oxidoreductase [Priestia aryabhattai]|uniref:NADP-dependent oxidoreductase n=1 Tax=Bacillaceae TaxID=186817 RepID=UPI000BA03A17|nr:MULTISPECIES: NADP-dependent oxidoreductase [Bacillaceae]MDT2046279.1 NADP-dependent oxidoreductase [Priestia flexa]OZT10752.1 NADP-dependent oxidoreductase [Priestia aryabhattai]TDB50035.1 NADP-dependent oxidoreductase [Bacillus sp. CBEL-1]USY53698.1 NADP-dependent oxidoreductase [Bacillus sp. 1780r2a1]